MNSQNRSTSESIWNCIDMLLGAAVIYSAWLFSCLASPPALFLYEPRVALGIIFAVVLSGFMYRAFDIYSVSVFSRALTSVLGIIKANICSGIIMLIAVLAFRPERDYEHFLIIWTAVSVVLSSAVLSLERRIIRWFLGFLHRKRLDLRRVIIVGDNAEAAKEYVSQVDKNLRYGIAVIGCVCNKASETEGIEKLGEISELDEVLDEYRPTEVVFAIDSYDRAEILKLVNICDDRCVKVYFLPVIYGFFKSVCQLERVGALPVVNIHTTPLDNTANAFIKRLTDIVGSILLIIITSPVMLFAAVGIKISSEGAVLFKQVRVGKMGKRFTMLKFRSMRAELGSDEIWTKGSDPRKTRFGAFLRRSAIDELPQLFNVLFGSMSLVGPRPELPTFVEHFRGGIPLYMVKHYVKPGITGLAQIKGLRGDTSVERRIREDIDYIENWSFWLDLYILFMTPFKAFNKNEVYVRPEPEREQKAERIRGEKLKILYAASAASHIESFHLPYIEALRKDGHTVLTMARGRGMDFDILFEKKILSLKNLKNIKTVGNIIEKEKFDLVILNTSLAAFLIRLALKGKRPKTLNIVHGYLFSENGNNSLKAKLKSRFFLIAEKTVAGRTDALITMNSEDKCLAEKHRLSSGGLYEIRGMGASRCSPTASREEIRASLGADRSFVLLFVGELSKRKNEQFLISAMPYIIRIKPDAELWLVGDGDERKALLSLAVKLKVDHRVRFLGHREDVSVYLNAADLYVSAALCEGIPFNIIEALGAGLTVIASDVKGNRDVLSAGAGILYTSGDIAEYTHVVESVIIGKKKINREMKEQTFLKYSIENVFDNTLEIIKKAGGIG